VGPAYALSLPPGGSVLCAQYHGDEMDVIGHEAIRQNLDFKGAAPLSKKFEVALVILITEKGRLSSISTLNDVMGKTWCDDAS
jgi:hypothetical protein